MRSTAVYMVLLSLALAANANRLPGFLGRMPSARRGDTPPQGCCLQTNAFSVNASITSAVAGNSSSWYANEFIQVDLKNKIAFIALAQDRVMDNLPETDVYMWYQTNATSGGYTQTYYIKGQNKCYTQQLTPEEVGGLFGPYCFDTAHGFQPFEYVLLGSTLLNVQAKVDQASQTGEYMAVESATCLPIVNTQIAWGEQNSASYTQMLFFDHALRIVAPNAFKVPSGCDPLPPALLRKRPRNSRLLEALTQRTM